MKIALLIPSTSNKRNWNELSDCYLHNILLPTFYANLNTKERSHNFIIYLGIDDDDKFYNRDDIRFGLVTFINNNCPNFLIKFISTSEIKKGYVGLIWNRLFKYAYEEDCDYFLQSGDDIEFLDKGWLNKSIKILQDNERIGVVGLKDINRHNNDKLLLTQTFVSRLHYEIFGFYFPNQIINWYVDDWITNIYKNIDKMFLIDERLDNKGGEPRYEIKDEPNKCEYLVNKYSVVLSDALQQIKDDKEGKVMLNNDLEEQYKD